MQTALGWAGMDTYRSLFLPSFLLCPLSLGFSVNLTDILFNMKIFPRIFREHCAREELWLLKQPGTHILSMRTYIQPLYLISKLSPVLFLPHFRKALKCSPGKMDFSASVLTNTRSFFCRRGDAWTSHPQPCQAPVSHHPSPTHKAARTTTDKGIWSIAGGCDLPAEASCLSAGLVHLSRLICLDNHLWKLKEEVGKKYFCFVGDERTNCYLGCFHSKVRVYTHALHVCFSGALSEDRRTVAGCSLAEWLHSREEMKTWKPWGMFVLVEFFCFVLMCWVLVRCVWIRCYSLRSCFALISKSCLGETSSVFISSAFPSLLSHW